MAVVHIQPRAVGDGDSCFRYLVEGEDLGKRLSGGKLPLRDVLRLARTTSRAETNLKTWEQLGKYASLKAW